MYLVVKYCVNTRNVAAARLIPENLGGAEAPPELAEPRQH